MVRVHDPVVQGQPSRPGCRRRAATEKGGGIMTAVEMKLPGQPRSRTTVEQEYREEREQAHLNFLKGPFGKAPATWQLLGAVYWPEPEQLYRWRVKLDCGDIQEVWSRGEDAVPEGDRYCFHTESPLVYRRIEKWHSGPPDSPFWTAPEVHDFEADPVEPPDEFTSDDPEADRRLREHWARRRHTEPYQLKSWQTRLECGHTRRVPMRDLDWKPGDPPRLVLPEQAQRDKALARLEEYWAENPEETWSEGRDHERRDIAAGMPDPDPEQDCHQCANAHAIVGYERVGWLVKKPPPPPTPREKLETKRAAAVRRAERAAADAEKARADAERFAAELADLEED